MDQLSVELSWNEHVGRITAPAGNIEQPRSRSASDHGHELNTADALDSLITTVWTDVKTGLIK